MWPSFAVAGLGLRPATADDLPYLRQLYQQTRQAEMACVAWPEPLKRQFLDQQFALQHRHYLEHYADAAFLLVQHVGSRCGRLYVQTGAPDFLVIDIALDTSMRGRGIGSVLMHAVQEEAKARSRGVRLHVDLRNEAAHRLYLRLGFRDIGTEGTYRGMRWGANVS